MFPYPSLYLRLIASLVSTSATGQTTLFDPAPLSHLNIPFTLTCSFICQTLPFIQCHTVCYRQNVHSFLLLPFCQLFVPCSVHCLRPDPNINTQAQPWQKPGNYGPFLPFSLSLCARQLWPVSSPPLSLCMPGNCGPSSISHDTLRSICYILDIVNEHPSMAVRITTRTHHPCSLLARS